MSAIILFTAVSIAQIMLVAAMAIVSIRMFVGPRAQDRIIGLDTFYINAMLLLVTFGVGTGRVVYFEAALVIGMIGFVATVALAKFLMRGEVIE
jgi:multicomponent K+:H+ antiporter subunit F